MMAMPKYIEREALKKLIAEQCAGECDVCYYNGDCGCSLMDCAPVIDVAQVVHGQWIYIGTSVDGKKVFECSACHNDISAIGPYCKECGAKMDKEDDNG